MSEHDTRPEEPVEAQTSLTRVSNFRKNLEKNIILAKAVGGETLCTFLFMFIVEATAFNNSRATTAQYTSVPLIEALCTGFAATALIYSFADVSGAHFNPAVSFATFITGKISLFKFVLFVCAQLIGTTLASIMLIIAFPGMNGPKVVAIHKGHDTSLYEAFIMEVILTFILVYVIFATAFDKIENQNIKVDLPEDYNNLLEGGEGAQAVAQQQAALEEQKKKKKAVMPKLTIYTTGGGFAPMAIGFTLGFLNFVGGTVSGGCYNPARAFGPALVGNEWSDHWLYWLADFVGAALAGYTQMLFAHNQPDPLGFLRPVVNFIQKKRAGAQPVAA
jgi:glycerol uptake facilitator-like aquaporin